MTHVSRKKLDKKFILYFSSLLDSILSNSNKNDIHSINKILITKTEEAMIIKRLAIIYYLEKGYLQDEIAEITGTTRQTVARIETQLKLTDKNRLKTLTDKINTYNEKLSFSNKKSSINLSKSSFQGKMRKKIIG